MSRLKAWADSSFDLIVHAEECLRKGTDFDRRVALILFDNSIEVAINVHLNSHPVQRRGLVYENEDVTIWSRNFHTKLDFLFDKYIPDNGFNVSFDRADLIHCHDIRNGQYHAGGATIPRSRDLEDIRKAALEIFSILYEVDNVETELEARISERDFEYGRPKRTSDGDKLIDELYGMTTIADQTFYTSEALFGVDRDSYASLVEGLKAESESGDEEAADL